MRKTSIGTSVAAAACLLLASAVTPGSAAAAAQPSVWVASGADHVFSSSPAPQRPTNAVTLFAARNEVQAAQIVVRAAGALNGMSVQASDLSGPAGAVIPSSRITVNREYNHPNIAKIQSGRQQEPPDGGTTYYDALVGNAPHQLAANTTQPYHYSVAVPTGQAPGTYTGKATVQSSAGPVDVPVSVKVYDAEVPPANRSAFRMNNWFTSVGWDYKWTASSIPDQYGIADFSPEWWTLMGNFAKNYAKHRNNVIYADFQALSIPDTKLVDGKYTFTWQNFDRFVQLFQDAGALQYIYTPTLVEDAGRNLETLVPDGKGGVKMGYLTPGSPEATAYVNAVLPALKAHLDSKCLDAGPTCAPGRRWSDVFYMSAVDEPYKKDETQVSAARWLYERYHAYFPQGQTNEAHHEAVPALDDVLGTTTPILDDHYDANAGYYQNRRLAGKDLWLYYCIGPRDRHPNRFISYPLSDSRLTPWMASAVGAKGFLHWGWNIWTQPTGDPQRFDHVDTFDGWTNGDPFLVRPNKNALDVYDSMRSEALLAGIQDYELLTQLAAAKPVLARALTSSLITNTTEFTTSGAELDQRHKQILDALTGQGPDASYPFTEDFSAGNDAEWRHTRGSWSVTGDQAYVQSSTAADWDTVSAVAGRAYGDVAASADVRITGVSADGGATNWAGLTVHSQNPTDRQTGYLVALRDNGEVFVNRSGVDLAKARVPGYSSGQTVTLRAVTRGSALKVYAGATELISLTDTGYPVGNVGLATGGASARFDNVRLNPGTNPVEGAAVSASSSYEADGWSAKALTDGRRSLPTGTVGWSSVDNLSVDHTESVTVDLGAARRISRLDLFGRADGANTGLGFPVDFTVQVSTDNATWTTVADKRDHPRPDASGQSFPFAAADVRYVKVTGTKLRKDPHGNYHLQLAEIEAAGENLAANRPVTVSSSIEGSGWKRRAATDGALNSAQGYSLGWSSQKSATAAANEWITVDLQGPSLISQVRLTPRTDGVHTGLGFPVDLTVQVSADNVNWTTVADKRGLPRPGADTQTFSFEPASARYVKISGTRLSVDQFGEHYMQLGEIGVG